MRSTIGCAAILLLATSTAFAQADREVMPPIEDYLLDESFEIALATSAAPEHIGSNAAVLVLRRDGYHRVREGTNGFTCLVERSWSVPLRPDRPAIDFWSPKIVCPSAITKRPPTLSSANICDGPNWLWLGSLGPK